MSAAGAPGIERLRAPGRPARPRAAIGRPGRDGRAAGLARARRRAGRRDLPGHPGLPDDRLARTPPPRDASREPELEPPVPAAWAWPEDEDEDEDGGDADEANVPDLDEQIEILDDDDVGGLEILDEDGLSVPSPSSRESTGGNGASHVALPVVPSRDWNEDRRPVEGAEEDDFTFSRSGPMTVEELDLAPMVDVAFQLVLFFMVTATTVLYKTLEIPKPTTDQAPGSVAQGHSRSLDDLQEGLRPGGDRCGGCNQDRPGAGRRRTSMRWPSGCGRLGRRRGGRSCCSRRTTRRRTAMRCWPTTRRSRSTWGSRSPGRTRRRGRHRASSRAPVGPARLAPPRVGLRPRRRRRPPLVLRGASRSDVEKPRGSGDS